MRVRRHSNAAAGDRDGRRVIRTHRHRDLMVAAAPAGVLAQMVVTFIKPPGPDGRGGLASPSSLPRARIGAQGSRQARRCAISHERHARQVFAGHRRQGAGILQRLPGHSEEIRIIPGRPAQHADTDSHKKTAGDQPVQINPEDHDQQKHHRAKKQHEGQTLAVQDQRRAGQIGIDICHLSHAPERKARARRDQDGHRSGICLARRRSPMTGTTDITSVLGPLAAVLTEADVVEISCNPSGAVWVERFAQAPGLWGQLDRARAERFVRWCATWSQDSITTERPIFSGRIPGTQHRIEALIPPVVEGPTFSIRRHREQVISLAEYIEDPKPRALVAEAIAAKRNILIAGATGSGKTTLLNTCLHHLAEIAPQTRLITIEDTPEIRTPLKNALALVSTDAVSMDRLLISTLRLAPDRIVVGELREGQVLMTLIKAWNTGHPGGLVTLHANSGADVIPRLRMLACEVLQTDPTPALLASLDMIVFVRRGRDRPIVETIAARRTGADGSQTLETLHDQS